MTDVNLAHCGDALLRNPSTWVWLFMAVLSLAACLRVLLLVGSDSWLSMGVIAAMGWIMAGCRLDLALAGPTLGHFGDVLVLAGRSAVRGLVGGRVLAGHASERLAGAEQTGFTNPLISRLLRR